MINQPFRGAACLMEGFRLLRVAGLRRYVALPIAVNIAVFALLAWLAAGWFGSLVDALLPQLPEWLAWLGWLLWGLFAIAAAVVMIFTFTLFANLIGSPFNGLLAEAVERHLTGNTAEPTGLLETLRDVPVSLLDELRKIGYFARWAVPLLVLFFIPGVNLIAPFLWALFSAWMLAVEYADYPMGNHAMKGQQQRSLLGKRRFLALGFGGSVLAATLVPVVNLLVMPAAVAGATVLWVRELKDE